MKIYRSNSGFELLESFSLPSPALSIAQHPLPSQERFIAWATMEGSVSVIDVVSREVVARAKDHNKVRCLPGSSEGFFPLTRLPSQYIVKVAFSPSGDYLATLGYDRLIHIYRFKLTPLESDAPAPNDDDDEAEPEDPLATCPSVNLELVHTVTTRTNPEAAVWLPVFAGQAIDGEWLVWTAREDNLLHYVKAPAVSVSGSEEVTRGQKWETEEWNLNENGDSFISFSM